MTQPENRPTSLAEALAAVQTRLPAIAKTRTAHVKSDKGSYCVAPQTRVLTHDLQWIEAHKLAVGDRLVAFDEMPESTMRCRRWRSAEVQAVRWLTQPAYRIHLADGTELVASATHRWLVMNSSQFMTWADTKDLHTPDRKRAITAHPSHLVRVVDMWPEELSYEVGYLAAAFDGEGCLVQTPIKRASGLALRDQTYQLHCIFSQRDNEMRRRVDTFLAHFGFAVHEGQPGGTNGDVCRLRIAGGRPEVLRFLGQIRPVRLLSSFTADHLGTFRCKERVAVDAVEFLGEQPVIAVQTSTRTFVAEGFASHNSYDYADLADVTEAVLPLLGAVGLSWICRPTFNADGKFVLAYKLLHASGQFEEGEYPLPASAIPQAMGSAISYARRYALCAVTGAAPEGDDDEERLASAPAKPRQAQRRTPPQQSTPPDRDDRPAPRTAQRAARPAAGPPLPGEDGHAEPASDLISGPQRGMVLALFDKAGISERDERLDISRRIIGRPDLGSANELTKGEASRLIKWMEEAEKDDFTKALAELLSKTEATP